MIRLGSKRPCASRGILQQVKAQFVSHTDPQHRVPWGVNVSLKANQRERVFLRPGPLSQRPLLGPILLDVCKLMLNTSQRGSAGKNLPAFHFLFTSNPTPLTMGNTVILSQNQIWGMWIGCSQGSEDPRRMQSATCLFEHCGKDTSRVRHAGDGISLIFNQIKISLQSTI